MAQQGRLVHKEIGSINVWKESGLNMQGNRIRNVGTPVARLDATNKAYVDGTRFVGDLKMSAKPTDHTGWLLCDGRSLQKSAFAGLYEAIGAAYGGDASSFKLPDCRGRVLGSIGQGVGLTTRQLGDAAGEELHTLAVAEMPTHAHTGETDTSGNHTHNYFMGKDDGNLSNNAGQYPPGDGNANVYGMQTSSAGAHSHTFTTDTAGNSQSFNVMQPTIFVGNTFIFVGVTDIAE
jgi:microcystin-dependent protein